MRLFEKYFKLPLVQDDYAPKMVWTESYDRAFDFERTVKSGDAKKIVSKLNGAIDGKLEGELTHSDGYVYLDGEKLLFIRSWGRLTGGGALNLSPEKAVEIQDDFCEWIIEKLKE